MGNGGKRWEMGGKHLGTPGDIGALPGTHWGITVEHRYEAQTMDLSHVTNSADKHINLTNSDAPKCGLLKYVILIRKF